MTRETPADRALIYVYAVASTVLGNERMPDGEKLDRIRGAVYLYDKEIERVHKDLAMRLRRCNDRVRARAVACPGAT